MAKLPDFSELTKKFDIQGLVDTVKSAVSGSSTPAKAPEGDEIAAKFVEVITLTQNLATAHAEQAKAIAAVHNKLNALYKDLQTLKNTAATPAVAVKEPATDTTVENSTSTESDPTDSKEKPNQS